MCVSICFINMHPRLGIMHLICDICQITQNRKIEESMPHVNELTKGGIIAKIDDGWSVRQTAAFYNVNRNTVLNILRRWRNDGRINRNPGSGRPRKSTAEQDAALINTLRAHPFTTVVDAVAATNFPASCRTGRRRVAHSELKCHAAAKKILLNNGNKESRLGFALEHIAHDEEFWNSVIFTDEKVFQSSNSGNIRVYRPRNSRFDENYINFTNRSGHFSVNIWTWISAQGPGVLWHIGERFNSEAYIRILENVMLPSVQLLFPNNGFIFQQDNCPVHTSRVVTEYFRAHNINVLDWPSKSPDLNPVENVWAMLVKTIRKANVRPRNVEGLLEVINNAWEEVTEEYCFQLYRSMPRRLGEVIEHNGGITKY